MSMQDILFIFNMVERWLLSNLKNISWRHIGLSRSKDQPDLDQIILIQVL